MGSTQVSFPAVENILMMTLKLEKLILPNHMACCLCEAKSTIEVVCKTIKLQCDNECLINTTRCSEQASLTASEGTFMRALQARKKYTSTELTIEPEKASSDKRSVNFSTVLNDPSDLNGENDGITALDYILPYLSEGNLGNIELTLLPFIKLLFSNIQDREKVLGYVQSNTGNLSPKLKSDSASSRNVLRNLYFLQNLIDSEIQEKIDAVKNKKKAAMLMQPTFLGTRVKRQTFPKELEAAQPQEGHPAHIQRTGVREGLPAVNRVLKMPRNTREEYLKLAEVQSIERKEEARPLMENSPEPRRRRRPAARELEQLHEVQRPRVSGGGSLDPKPSSSKEHTAAVSSFQKQGSMGRPSTLAPLQAPPEAGRQSKDLTEALFVLEGAKARVRNMEASESESESRKSYLFPYTRSHVIHGKPKVKMSKRFRKVHRPRLGNRAPIPAVRSLINAPPPEAFEPLAYLRAKNVLPGPEPSAQTTTAHSEPMLTQTSHQIMAHKDASPADSAVTHETHRESYTSTDSPSQPDGSSLPPLSSPGDQLETQLNQQLQSLIPNNSVRKLISHVIRTLKLDCTEPQVQLACAKLVSRTGLLMKLLNEQEAVKESTAEWDTDSWKTENFINEEQKEHESDELTKEVRRFGYNNKPIMAIGAAAVMMILLTTIIFCLIAIHSRRAVPEDDEGKSTRGFFQRLLCRRCASENQSQEGFFWRRRPVWLRDMYRPLSATHKKNMAQKLHDKGSSDEDEIFNKETREAGLTEVVGEEPPPSEMGDEITEDKTTE